MNKMFKPIRRAFGFSPQERKEFYEEQTNIDTLRKIDIRAEAEKYKGINEEVYNMEGKKIAYKGTDKNAKVYYRWIYLW